MWLAEKISAYNRKKKWRIFLDTVSPSSGSTILDVGFAENERSEADNYLEKNYPHPDKVTALGVRAPVEFAKRYPGVRAISYNGTRFPFDDRAFDVCFSNAVLEHVGSAGRQLIFLKEISRVSKTAFIATPNKRFPIELHSRIPLLHFLPKKIFDHFLRLVGKSWCTGDYLNLLRLKDIKRLLSAARIDNYRIIKNRLFFFTVNYIILIGTGGRSS
jgi:hypothetical protein